MAASIYAEIFQKTNSLFLSLGLEWGLAVISGVTTVVLVAVTTLHVMEAKKLREELGHPHLSLEPEYFVYDSKTGAITGFNCLNLVNSGMVARDVEIDISFKEKNDFLYVAAIGTNNRVQIWNGEPAELGKTIEVKVRCLDSYNHVHREELKIDINALRTDKRRFASVQNKNSEKSHHLETVGKAIRHV